jgi:hypothetical protein
MEISIDFLDNYPKPKMISKGVISNMNGDIIPYKIELGLSKSSIIECNEWKKFVSKFIMEFVDKNPSIKDYKKELQEKIMLEDFKWNWSKKALFLNTSEYNWFFLKTTDGIQSVCLTFHPKKSILQKIDIFYIKFIASAPWNRVSSLHERKYTGTGKEIIKQVQLYFRKEYRYEYGFSLHSLPQARLFYESLGMINLPDHNDENGLSFYEMNKEQAVLFMGENHA